VPERVLLDTDILSYFIKGHSEVQSRVKSYVEAGGGIRFSLITYYEIVSGLKHRDARGRLNSFLIFAKECEVLPLTVESVSISAEAYAVTRKNGKAVDDIDLLIAGVAIQNNCVLITHNKRHFEHIPGLEIEDWSLTALA
jgi:tRNA(fMet)-specific endonuclease VapC